MVFDNRPNGGLSVKIDTVGIIVTGTVVKLVTHLVLMELIDQLEN